MKMHKIYSIIRGKGSLGGEEKRKLRKIHSERFIEEDSEQIKQGKRIDGKKIKDKN